MTLCRVPCLFSFTSLISRIHSKFLIAGPTETPYSNALFEFDCFMPLNYPHSPPLVHLRTTGGGRVRFNPNLYQCGKVCLSLLGTWPGRYVQHCSFSEPNHEVDEEQLGRRNNGIYSRRCYKWWSVYRA
jgi:ubiquitin-protein ligase